MANTSGLRRYYGSEAGNVLLGQLGFDILASDDEDISIKAGAIVGAADDFSSTTDVDGTDAQCWVCIQVNDPGSSVEVSVKSAIGNDFTDITFSDGIKIYGVFTGIRLSNVAAGDHLICYRG
jgi:hypothetical protein